MDKIRLTEAKLHKVINESVKKVLRENNYKHRMNEDYEGNGPYTIYKGYDEAYYGPIYFAENNWDDFDEDVSELEDFTSSEDKDDLKKEGFIECYMTTPEGFSTYVDWLRWQRTNEYQRTDSHTSIGNMSEEGMFRYLISKGLAKLIKL